MMKYLLIILSLVFISCSTTHPDSASGITVAPATECSQLTGEQRRECVQQYQQNPSDYEEVMAE